MVKRANIEVDVTKIPVELQDEYLRQLRAFAAGLADSVASVASAEPVRDLTAASKPPRVERARHVLAHGLQARLKDFAAENKIDINLVMQPE